MNFKTSVSRTVFFLQNVDDDYYSHINMLLCVVFYAGTVASEHCPKDKFKVCPTIKSGVKLGSKLTLNCSSVYKLRSCVWYNPQNETLYATLDGKNGNNGNGGYNYNLRENITENSCNLTIYKIGYEDDGNFVCSPVVEGHEGDFNSPPALVVVNIEPRKMQSETERDRERRPSWERPV